MQNGILHPNQMDQSISILRDVGWSFSFVFKSKWNSFYINSGDPDQTPRSAASDLGLHRLHMSNKKDARLIWVNKIFNSNNLLI